MERIGHSRDVKFWEQVRKLIGEASSNDVVCKVSVPLSHIEAVFRYAEEIRVRDGLDFSLTGHAGSGIVYIHMCDPDPSSIPEIVSGLREQAIASHGSLVVSAALAETKRRMDVWGRSGGDVELMRGLKMKMDPRNVMSPGRFVGGL